MHELVKMADVVECHPSTSIITQELKTVNVRQDQSELYPHR